MGTFVGVVLGLGVGLWLSVMFIFPDNVLNIPLSAMTLGYILRLLGGLSVTLLGAAIGGFIGSMINDGVFEKANPDLEVIREHAEKEALKGPASNARVSEYLKMEKRAKEGKKA